MKPTRSKPLRPMCVLVLPSGAAAEEREWIAATTELVDIFLDEVWEEGTSADVIVFYGTVIYKASVFLFKHGPARKLGITAWGNFSMSKYLAVAGIDPEYIPHEARVLAGFVGWLSKHGSLAFPLAETATRTIWDYMDAIDRDIIMQNAVESAAEAN